MFYHFSLNNSGGSFVFDGTRGITHHVVIEAADAKDANDRAEKIGLYLDGVGDCECCGERWMSFYPDEEGDETPTVYGKPVEEVSHRGPWSKTWREYDPKTGNHSTLTHGRAVVSDETMSLERKEQAL